MLYHNLIKRNMSHSKKAWFKDHVNDQYVKKAQTMGFRSRAAFKLLQIQERYKIMKQGNKVLDLGSAPGSWCQALQNLNPKIQIAAVDLLPMKEITGIDFYQTDARNEALHKLLMSKFGKFDIIVSDMAPNFSGTLFQTHEEMIQLNKCCLDLSLALGCDHCNLVMKTVEGQWQKQMLWLLQYFYEEVGRFKPKSSRSESVQHYLVCLGKKKFKDQEQMLKNVHNLLIKKVKLKRDIEELMRN